MFDSFRRFRLLIFVSFFLQCDELQTQRKLRNELIQLEDTLAKVGIITGNYQKSNVNNLLPVQVRTTFSLQIATKSNKTFEVLLAPV